MPVTINTLTSSVNVTEGVTPNAELIEQLVQTVLTRLRHEHEEEKRGKDERKMSDRMSQKDDY
jgi:hypothetical protein